jgi:hypothetical protein
MHRVRLRIAQRLTREMLLRAVVAIMVSLVVIREDAAGQIRGALRKVTGSGCVIAAIDAGMIAAARAF